MSEINPVTSTGTTTTTSSSAIDTDTFSEDFDAFLQLLTAQIQNQDPLQPLESTQFVEQLATFSSLEQQVKTNGTLENIASMISDLHSAQANEWLGQEVAVSSQYVAYEGEPVEFEINPAFNYDEAILTVTDSSNQVIWQEALDASADRYTWNGETSDSTQPAGQGVYEFQIDLFANGQPLASTQAEIISKVTTLANEGGQLKLGTNNYLTTDLDGVRKTSSE
ncbi:MAG: flagellar hook capping FlgD N-terminal domain-containing protein [Pseudomonadota bacterium]